MTPVYISDFHSVCPKFLLSQDQSVKNMVDIRLLMNQKRVALDLDKPIERKRIEAKVQRFGLANSKIKERRTEVGDYVVVLPGNESELTFFNSAHLPTLDSRMSFYSDRVQEVFKEFYPVQKGESAPDQLIHVSCTGYSSPSPAQRIVAQWEKPSTVTHAYHMGCYASLPALRLARGLSASAPAVRENEVPYKVDIVHNELCSLHVNPLDFDPQQMVVQSLFADGHMKYSETWI